MKNIFLLISIILLFIFINTPALADSCLELSPVLEKYYKAGQEENLEKYMEVMDQNYLRENLLNNYKDYVKSAWEVYDTKHYEIKKYNCKLDRENALMYFNLKSTLSAKEKDIETQRNYIALFHKIGEEWKIKYVMDEDIFSQFQSGLYAQLFLDASKDEIHKEVDKANQIIEYNKITEELLKENLPNTIEDGIIRKKIDSKESSNKNKIIYIFLTLIIGGSFIFIKIKKKN